MHISKLKIKNFKCFDEVEINFDANFNLIIGENNSGKSTIFEALRLWQLAIQQFYTERTGKKGDGSKNMGFYKSYSFKPLQINDISFLRIDDLNNILFNKTYKSKDEDNELNENNSFLIELTFSNHKNFSAIPLVFRTNNKNTLSCKILISNDSDLAFTNEEELIKISHSLSKVFDLANNASFKNRIRLAYIPPKFTLPNKELLLSERNAFILEKLIMGESQLVIRNILHHWSEFSFQAETKGVSKEKIYNSKELLKTIIDENEFRISFDKNIKPYIEDVLGYVIKHKRNKKSKFLIHIEDSLKAILNQSFNFTSESNPLDKYSLQIKNKNERTEISQLGSGTINVLNILTVLYYNEQTIENAATKSNILLLDEPDSHLHSNLQANLFKFLKKESLEVGKQIFIITHNSNLISQFENLLFIQNNKKIHYPILINDYLENHLKDMDENQYNVIKELSETKVKMSTIEKKIEDDNKIYFLFEGPTDRKIFSNAYKKIYDIDFPYETIDNISSVSDVRTFLNGSDKKIGYLIGVFDNDHAGRTQYNNLNKDYKLVDEYTKQRNNNYAFLLPVPTYRDLEFYKKHLTIEYLFNDSDLLNILGEEYFYKADKELYFKIKSDDNNQAYVIPNSLKSKISEESKNLPKESFGSFKSLFERINVLIDIKLPDN